MRMRDHSALDRAPRIDIEAAGGTEQPRRLGADEIQRCFFWGKDLREGRKNRQRKHA